MANAPLDRRRLCELAFAVLLAGVGVPAAPGAARAAAPRRYVQKRIVRITSGSDASVSFTRPNGAGSLIVAYVVADNTGAVTLSDSRGNTYASAVGPTTSPGTSITAQIFYAANLVGGSNTVTAHFATPIAAEAVLYALEYNGVDRSAPVEAVVSATGVGTAVDSGNLTTGEGNALLFVGASSDRAVTRRPAGFRVRSRKAGNMIAEQITTGAGVYHAASLQRGTAWSMQLVAFRPPVSTPPATAYPLKVGPTGRYLVDQNDVPFLMVGDSPQALTVNLSEAEADAFFADRAAAGFNLVWVNLLCASYTGGRPDGSTYDGIVPFTTPGDLATPNEQFFARVDHLLQLAAQHGLVVLLDPAETGSYLSVLNANGVAKARDYGRYLGARYRDVDNIIWMSGNDFQSWENAGDDAVVQAVARGIQDTDSRHLHTVELDYLVSGSLDDPSWAPLIQLNASYTYYPTYAQVLADYDRPNALPTFLVEANYEFEHNAADEGTPEILRRQAYWAMLSGAAGQLYGNRYTWPFAGDWQSHLDTPGSAQMTHVRFLFASRRWYDLVPDQTHTVVTAGYGTFADAGALGDNDYLTAARTPDGALVMAYMPTRRTITVAMSSLAGAADASWYDPSDGTFTPIAGSPFANNGQRTFTPPGNNADGDGDWVLVLEASGLPPDTEPPSVPTGLSASSIGDTRLTLGWSAATDNVAVAGYRIFRDGPQVHATASTSYTDTGLAPLTAYTYRVAAYDFANNESALSAPFTVTTTAPAPTFVQQGSAVPQSPQSVVSATYPVAQTAGDTNIVAVGWNDTSAVIASVTDSAGNAYQVAAPTVRGNGLSQAVYYAPNVAAAGANQVTVTFDRAAVFVDLRITEYAGLRHTTPFHTAVSATGTGSSAATPVLTTTAASELLFAAGMTSATFTGAGTGYTSRVITSPDGDLIEDAVASTAGNYTAAAPLNSGTWLLQLAAFTP